jgi:deoxycytidine triphosphate deaminase
MVLSDKDIAKYIRSDELVIDPYKPDNIEPASVDLRLGEDFKRPERKLRKDLHKSVTLDKESDRIKAEQLSEPIELDKNDFILATTKEYVEIPDDLSARVLGRSSFGRLGISVHQTAGFIDPGFKGQITLELCNHGFTTVEIEPDKRVCQIVFEKLSSPAAKPYGHEDSQYQNQSGATLSGMSLD